MREFGIEERLHQILCRLYKKDRNLYDRIWKKIYEIINSSEIEHYKNLRHDLKDFKRVHIGKFVLIFKFDKTNNCVLFFDFDHHDRIYQKRF